MKILLLLITTCLLTSANIQDDYKCMPCGQDCDTKLHHGPGNCTECNMPLVKASTIKFDSIEPEVICNYIKRNPETILLDVRTKAEFEEKDGGYGSLKNAINIPLQELKKRIDELASYKNKEIIVYCSHSHRSPQASYILSQNGFKNVLNMQGGMSQLKDDECKRKD